MSEAKGQHEPSMEEILASIRRIIAEDGDAIAPAAAPAPAPTPVAPPPVVAAEPAAKPVSEPAPDEILELTEMIEPDEPVVEDTEEPEPPKPPARSAELARPVPSVPEDIPAEGPIVSPATAAASVAALSRITELSTREGSGRDIGLGAGHLTLEMLVREELRPILRDWLDSHLPGIVERIVKSEIARLVQGVPKR